MANATAIPSLQELLEAGVHFGHQVKRWHPQMAPYIYTARDNIHIIDLLKTREQLVAACAFLKEQAAQGKVILFLGTKRQAQDIVREEAMYCGMPYLDKRWIGGLMTNWDQMKKNLEKLREYEANQASGKLKSFTKKEQLLLRRKMAKLESELAGVKNLMALPDVLFIIDPKKEDNAVREAMKRHIPTVAICDTNTNPQSITYAIPANDDSLKSVKLLVTTIASAIAEGKAIAEKANEATSKTDGKDDGELVVANIQDVLEEVVEEVEGIVEEDQEKVVQNNESTPSEAQSEANKTESDISEKKQSKEKIAKAKAVKKTATKKPIVKTAKKGK